MEILEIEDRLSVLPPECIDKIISYLSVMDVNSLKLQNKRLKSVSNSSRGFLKRIKLCFQMLKSNDLDDWKEMIKWMNGKQTINTIELYYSNWHNGPNEFSKHSPAHAFKLKIIEPHRDFIRILEGFHKCEELYLRSLVIFDIISTINDHKKIKLESLKKLRILFDFIFIEESNQNLRSLHRKIDFEKDEEKCKVKKENTKIDKIAYKEYRLEYINNATNIRLRVDFDICTKLLDLFEFDKEIIKHIRLDDYRGSTVTLLSQLNSTALDTCKFYLCDVGIIFEPEEDGFEFSVKCIDFDFCGFDFAHAILKHMNLGNLEVFKLRTTDSSDGDNFYDDILELLNGNCPNLTHFITEDDLFDNILNAEFNFPSSLRVLCLNSFTHSAESFAVVLRDFIRFERDNCDNLEVLETKFFYNCSSPTERDQLESLLKIVQEKYTRLKQFKMGMLCKHTDGAQSECSLRSVFGIDRDNYEYKFQLCEFIGCSQEYKKNLEIIIQLETI